MDNWHTHLAWICNVQVLKNLFVAQSFVGVILKTFMKELNAAKRKFQILRNQVRTLSNISAKLMLVICHEWRVASEKFEVSGS
mmetsp:Transcript_5431/g.4116  ORF Transcript_5431/g.4116 Transcript_5431/m.4116 type:complete len:83 (+) Transcript_5431:608-856(+)